MKYVYSKSENKFERSLFVVKTEQQKQMALTAGYVEVSDEDYQKLVNHELCWNEDRVLVPYTKTAQDIADEQKQEKINAITARIAELKSNLQAWDYKTSKYLDGNYTDSEWEQIVTQRTEWRDEINRLESELELL
ncbi:MAG: hypothetical protein J1G02_06605 [Clostridiales bacterium]|nr:hypothetical protein [Clostridiales bacterium]